MIQIKNLSISKNAHSFKLLGRILVKTEADKSKVGPLIVPPDHSQQKCIASEIISIGESINNDKEISIEHLKESLDMKVGDIVIYQNWAATEIDKDDRNDITYSILKAADVIAVIKKDDFDKVYSKGANI